MVDLGRAVTSCDVQDLCAGYGDRLGTDELTVDAPLALEVTKASGRQRAGDEERSSAQGTCVAAAPLAANIWRPTEHRALPAQD